MSVSNIESLKIKAKLLQKAKKKAGKDIQLKEAFEILAKSSGFRSWREMKELYEATEHYCPKGAGAHWKIWFKDYDEAKSQLGQEGRFLLPFRDHYFICEMDYIEFLGIEKSNVDLEKVGANWVEPQDSEAFLRLSKKIRDLQQEGTQK